MMYCSILVIITMKSFCCCFVLLVLFCFVLLTYVYDSSLSGFTSKCQEWAALCFMNGV